MKLNAEVSIIYEIGLRANQEDSLWPDNVDSFAGVCIICDGMGGHEKGEVASHAVCNTMGPCLVASLRTGNAFGKSDFEKALEYSYDRLDLLDDGDSIKKMGTTLAALVFHDGGAFVAHIGDSRVYHFRPSETGNGRIRFVTQDHSLVNELVAVGAMTEEDAKHSSRKNIITKAMMPNQDRRDVPSYANIDDIRAGDYFFVCTDGMLETMEDMEIVDVLSMNVSDSEKAEIFRKMTENNRDNHSAFIIKILAVND